MCVSRHMKVQLHYYVLLSTRNKTQFIYSQPHPHSRPRPRHNTHLSYCLRPPWCPRPRPLSMPVELFHTCIIQAHFIVHAHFLLHHPRPSHRPRPLSCFCLHCPHPRCPLPTAKFSNHNGTLVCIWIFDFITLHAFLFSFSIKKSFDLKNYFTHHESLAKKGGKKS